MVTILRSLDHNFGWQLGRAKSTTRLKSCEDANNRGRKVCWSQDIA
jgi:hypothetical protein